MTVFFTLKNNTQDPVSGTITSSFLGGVYRVNNLAPNETLTGSFSGAVTAKAGRGQTLSLSFYKDDPNSEFPNVSANSYGLGYDVAARFVFSLDNIECVQIRSAGFIVAGRDSDFAYFFVRVGDQVYPAKEFQWRRIGEVFGPQKDFVGRIRRDIHPVGIQTGPIDVVPGYGTPVVIGYQVINHGGQDLMAAQTFLDQVSGATAAALSIIYPGSKDEWQKLNLFTEWLNAAQFASQDGLCVSDLIDLFDDSSVVTMDFFAQKTDNIGRYTETRSYPQQNISPEDWDRIYNQGFPGHVPRYNVTWSVTRVGP